MDSALDTVNTASYPGSDSYITPHLSPPDSEKATSPTASSSPHPSYSQNTEASKSSTPRTLISSIPGRTRKPRAAHRYVRRKMGVWCKSRWICRARPDTCHRHGRRRLGGEDSRCAWWWLRGCGGRPLIARHCMRIYPGRGETRVSNRSWVMK